MFLKCGYNEAEINDAKASVLELDRLHILGIAIPGILPPPSLPPVPSHNWNPLTFASTYSCFPGDDIYQRHNVP